MLDVVHGLAIGVYGPQGEGIIALGELERDAWYCRRSAMLGGQPGVR